MAKSIMRILSVSWITGLVMILGTGLSFAAQDKMARLGMHDKSFVKDAAMGGRMEVELGRLAVNQASSQEVKDFGQRMVTDHSKVNDGLKSIADRKGIALPANLGRSHQSKINEMSSKRGMDFDRAYMKYMVKDHEKDIKAFEKESKKGTDPDLKAFAAETLPTLQEHLRLARQIEDQLKNRK